MSNNLDVTAPFALVVDDDTIIRMDAAEILEEAGFRTFEAEHSDQAVLVLEKEHARIVLLFTDVHMPGSRDGFALAREVAQRWPHIGIVVASGRALPGPGDMPLAARFIGKPFSAEVIDEHLRKVLPEGQRPEAMRRKE